MLVTILEVVVVAMIGVCLIVPRLPRVFRRGRPAAAGASERSDRQGNDARRQWARRIGGILFAIAIANFLAFSVHTSSLGGSAGNGKREDGRYYVGSHGHYTEVTEQQWRTVRTHEVTVFVTHTLGLLVGITLVGYSQRWWRGVGR